MNSYLFIIYHLLIVNLFIFIYNSYHHFINLIFIILKYLIFFQIKFIIYTIIKIHILIQYYLFNQFNIHFIIILILK